jgi:hypothetical protein
MTKPRVFIGSSKPWMALMPVTRHSVQVGGVGTRTRLSQVHRGLA